MCSDDQAIEEWTICFKNPSKSHWVQRMLKPGFHHCYAFKLSPGGQFYIIVDPARSHTHIDLVTASEEVFEELTTCYKFVKVLSVIDLNNDRGTFCRINCVEIIKSLIGYKSFWCWTPYDLYLYLIRSKAHE